MSVVLIALAKTFVEGRRSSEEFAEQYFDIWRQERNSGKSREDDDVLAECVSNLFCLADCFKAAPKLNDFDLNEIELRQKVEETLRKYGFIQLSRKHDVRFWPISACCQRQQWVDVF